MNSVQTVRKMSAINSESIESHKKANKKIEANKKHTGLEKKTRLS